MLIYQGFLLSYVKYGDHDAVLHCFTKETGFQSFFARGIYAARNKKKPYLFPLNLLQISAVGNPSKNGLSVVKTMELCKEYGDEHLVKHSSVLFFVADFLNQVLQSEPVNLLLFDEVYSLRSQIAIGNLDAYMVFLVRFIQISGVAPLVSPLRFIDPESGIFSDIQNHDLFTQDISDIWKEILVSPTPYDIRISRKLRADFVDSVMIYGLFHFSGFRIPRSLEILRQIYS